MESGPIMTATTTYQVTVTRDGHFWYIDIPATGGVIQARTLTEVDRMARDYIAGMLEVNQATIDLAVRINLPGEVTEHLEATGAAREAEAVAREQAAAESRAVARALQHADLTEREIGRVFGTCHQRAHQLVTA
jgi:hypothetical protein